MVTSTVKDRIRNLKGQLNGGLTPAMATPLHSDATSVDRDAIPGLVEFLLSKKVKGLFVGGTTGEGILLSTEERRILHRSAIEAVDGRVPVIIHVGSNDLNAAIALALEARSLGADAIAAVTPYYYGISDQAITDYYSSIAKAVPDTPVLLYDIPHLANNAISPTLAGSLYESIGSVAGIKTSTPYAARMNGFVKITDEDHILMAGNEEIALASLALGVDGLISGLSTAVPEPFVGLIEAFNSGNLPGARRIQQGIKDCLTIIRPGERIGSIKKILNERGHYVGEGSLIFSAPEGELWNRMKPILLESGVRL